MRSLRILFQVLSAWVLLGCGADGGVGLPSSPPLRSCNLVGCIDGAHFGGDVPIREADLGNLALRVCINGACEVVPVSLSLTGRSQVDCHGGRRAQCWVYYSGGTTVHLSLSLAAPPGTNPLLSLRDGDHYEVQLGQPGLPPLLFIDQFATYSVGRPNGPECEPICKGVRLKESP